MHFNILSLRLFLYRRLPSPHDNLPSRIFDSTDALVAGNSSNGDTPSASGTTADRCRPLRRELSEDWECYFPRASLLAYARARCPLASARAWASRPANSFMKNPPTTERAWLARRRPVWAK